MIEHRKQSRKQTFHCVQKNNQKFQSEMSQKLIFFLGENSFNCIKFQIFHHYMKAWKGYLYAHSLFELCGAY